MSKVSEKFCKYILFGVVLIGMSHYESLHANGSINAEGLREVHQYSGPDDCNRLLADICLSCNPFGQVNNAFWATHIGQKILSEFPLSEFGSLTNAVKITNADHFTAALIHRLEVGPHQPDTANGISQSLPLGEFLQEVAATKQFKQRLSGQRIWPSMIMTFTKQSTKEDMDIEKLVTVEHSHNRSDHGLIVRNFAPDYEGEFLGVRLVERSFPEPILLGKYRVRPNILLPHSDGSKISTIRRFHILFVPNYESDFGIESKPYYVVTRRDQIVGIPAHKRGLIALIRSNIDHNVWGRAKNAMINGAPNADDISFDAAKYILNTFRVLAQTDDKTILSYEKKKLDGIGPVQSPERTLPPPTPEHFASLLNTASHSNYSNKKEANSILSVFSTLMLFGDDLNWIQSLRANSEIAEWMKKHRSLSVQVGSITEIDFILEFFLGDHRVKELGGNITATTAQPSAQEKVIERTKALLVEIIAYAGPHHEAVIKLLTETVFPDPLFQENPEEYLARWIEKNYMIGPLSETENLAAVLIGSIERMNGSKAFIEYVHAAKDARFVKPENTSLLSEQHKEQARRDVQVQIGKFAEKSVDNPNADRIARLQKFMEEKVLPDPLLMLSPTEYLSRWLQNRGVFENHVFPDDSARGFLEEINREGRLEDFANKVKLAEFERVQGEPLYSDSWE